MKSSKLNAHLETAKIYSKLSKAKRLKVGCVIVKEDRIISIGYNGMPSGFNNNCEDEIEISSDDWTKVPKKTLQTKPEVVHAETNAISFAAKLGTSTNGATIVCTHSPCFECAKLIIQSGIKNVYYQEEYRDDSAIRFLKQADINVKSI